MRHGLQAAPFPTLAPVGASSARGTRATGSVTTSPFPPPQFRDLPFVPHIPPPASPPGCDSSFPDVLHPVEKVRFERAPQHEQAFHQGAHVIELVDDERDRLADLSRVLCVRATKDLEVAASHSQRRTQLMRHI